MGIIVFCPEGEDNDFNDRNEIKASERINMISCPEPS